ncbi:MAG TPA: TetR/AcrR family transcriptional regulator [Acidimicrobiales bacterium]|nr:TetR/AcrR family transcriptional regulator [Acidimicrobiales bacterium]
MKRQPEQAETGSTTLDVAERLVQSRGFNGFSYADVASELGITKAALHYHFRSKAELGQALIARYASRFGDALESIDTGDEPASTKLQAYADLYLGVLRDERMCLCGMLAAEYSTLPDRMQQTVVRFFDDNYAWLQRLLETGRVDGSLQFTGTAEAAAQMIVSTLEGAMLVARPYRDTARFQSVASLLIAEFTRDGRSVPRRRAREP